MGVDTYMLSFVHARLEVRTYVQRVLTVLSTSLVFLRLDVSTTEGQSMKRICSVQTTMSTNRSQPGETLLRRGLGDLPFGPQHRVFDVGEMMLKSSEQRLSPREPPDPTYAH